MFVEPPPLAHLQPSFLFLLSPSSNDLSHPPRLSGYFFDPPPPLHSGLLPSSSLSRPSDLPQLRPPSSSSLVVQPRQRVPPNPPSEPLLLHLPFLSHPPQLLRLAGKIFLLRSEANGTVEERHRRRETDAVAGGERVEGDGGSGGTGVGSGGGIYRLGGEKGGGRERGRVEWTDSFQDEGRCVSSRSRRVDSPFSSLPPLSLTLVSFPFLADFPCPLLYTSPTSICPSLTYAAALPESETSAGLLTSLPSNLTSIIETYLASFATTLSTYACGRDNYSPVSSCEMCYEVYREWLCRSLVPRVSRDRRVLLLSLSRSLAFQSCILSSCCCCSYLD